uniref:Reverse transcriptase zinc-binding domain-containing protein n=1 Tax=Anguilla anguilla TaxID=7936 RepID=A0A0E9UKP9_ANGAN
MSRRDNVEITRLRLGHCALKHGLALVGKHLDGKYVCGEAETVKHVLMGCTNYHAERRLMQAELSEIGVTDYH